MAFRKKIPLCEPVFAGNEWKYLKDCLDSGWVSSAGKYVELLEEKMAEYTGARFAVATVNGTAALHAALLVAGVGPGDYVVVPTLTFIATVNPVTYCGAIPVFVDAEEETLNMDPGKAVETIQDLVRRGRKPKALIVTHLYGHPCDMDPILGICREEGIWVIEDACESLGSTYKGKMTGTLGDMGCLSFNGNKIITTGSGGMILTDNAEFARRARYLTTQSRDDAVEYIHKEIGYNYRLTNLQAALGVAQLEELPMILKKKRGIAELYREALKEIRGTKFVEAKPWAQSNYWLSTILLERNSRAVSPREVIDGMAEEGIETRPIFSPLHTLKPFKKYGSPRLPISEACRGINLPSSCHLTEEELFRVIDSLKRMVWPEGKIGTKMEDAA
jgi:perosamine synthetase